MARDAQRLSIANRERPGLDQAAAPPYGLGSGKPSGSNAGQWPFVRKSAADGFGDQLAGQFMIRSTKLVTATLLVALVPGLGGAATREDGRRVRAEIRRQMRMPLDPASLLQTVYANFIVLQRCHQARRDSLATFIDAGEWARADAQARSLRERIKAFAPSVEDDVAWQRASTQVGSFSINAQNCRGSLSALENIYQDLDGGR